PACVRVRDHRVAADERLGRPDAVRVRAHVVEARGREQLAALSIDEADELHRGTRAQFPEIPGLERLDEDRGRAVIPPGALERGEQAILEREPEAAVILGMLGLRVDADRAALLLRLALHEDDDLVEGRDREPAVEALVAIRERLDRA